LRLGGINGRVEATGRGVFYGLQEACAITEDMKALGLTPGLNGKRAVVQGLGNVGYYTAKFLQEEGGADIIGIVEYEGAISKPSGIDVEELMAYRRETGSILNFPGAINLAHRDVGLELECDILVPAALESVITDDNAPRIKAKIIAEGANGPITADASAFLAEKGVLILPDAYVNGGGVVVSYFEWLKNLSHVRFGRMDRRFEEKSNLGLLKAIEQTTGKQFNSDEASTYAKGPGELDLVRSGLEDTMISGYHEIREILKRNNGVIDLRTASFINAIDKIAECYQDMGIFP
jgi:glutamate dehydrogenase (NAD(P)+)